MNRLAGFPSAGRTSRAGGAVCACFVLLFVPACQIPNLRSATTDLTVPTGYNAPDNSTAAAPGAPASSSARMGVDEFFTDPALLRLIQQSLTGNRELKVLEEDVQIARYEVQRRRGAYLPFVGYRGSTGLDLSSRFTRDGAVDSALTIRENSPIHNPLPDFLTSVNIFWQLDIWRELRNARDAAAQRYLAAVERRNAFVTKLVADVAENYYGLLALDQRQLTLDETIKLQQQSYTAAKALFDAGRFTELPVQRFQAEVRKNQSEKLIVRQEIVETENRINALLGRFPQPVERTAGQFFDLSIGALSAGVPAELLLYRPDVRQAERELTAAGLDVKSARARFYPRLDISAGVGYRAFNPKYLFNTPQALVANVAGDLTAPLINKSAIRADYQTANAQQLQAVYNYQQVILTAFGEAVNRVSMAENYGKSLELKRQQLAALEAALEAATKLFQNARVEYLEVLLAQRDLLEARTVVIDTKRQQLSAVVNAYQALGGGNSLALPAELPPMSRRQNKTKP